MVLPQEIQEKIQKLCQELKVKDLTQSRQGLTNRYKNETGKSRSLIGEETDGIVYAISRMPATFAVLSGLLEELLIEGKLQDIESVIDFGSGTGAGYFAVQKSLSNAKISLIERDLNMIKCFKRLCDADVYVETKNVLLYEGSADLVMTSYVLSEMTEVDRFKCLDKLLEMTDKYLLIIDTGTPQTYLDMIKMKEYVYDKGFSVTAPCMTRKCPLKNDYCQFYARVERSAVMRQVKNATLSYEDEKYFYLLIEKNTNANIIGKRVIRRPIFKENLVELKTCSTDGVSVEVFTKRNKELFKKAKKIKVNQLITED